MSRFINPITDFGFKRLFCNKQHKEILISAINILLRGEKTITSINFEDKEEPGIDFDGRTVIYDIHCTTDTGEHIIVEMQSSYQSHFKQRSIYYMATCVANQGQKGRYWNYHVDAVYGIFFMDFFFDPLRTDVILDIGLNEINTGKPFSDIMRMIYVTLPAMQLSKEECTNDLDKLIYVIKHMKDIDEMPFTEENPLFVAMEEVASYHSLNDDERKVYDRQLKTYRDNLAVWKGNFELGYTQGEIKGMQQGMQQGIYQEKMTIAKKLKATGMALDEIAKLTELSNDAIAKL